MRDLVNNEVEMIAGGDAAAVASTVILGLAAIAVISAMIPNNCRYVNEPFTTVTPVYDPYTGEYLGDQVDTYNTQRYICG